MRLLSVKNDMGGVHKMKYLLILAGVSIFCAYPCFGYDDGFMLFDFDRKGTVVTDSKEWIDREVKVESSTDCVHEWVFSIGSIPKRYFGVSCAVMHSGFHCSWNNLWREKICEKCGRLVSQEEIWHQHCEPPPPIPLSQFYILKSSFSEINRKEVTK